MSGAEGQQATTPPSRGDDTFACPECGARYRWNPDLEGKRIRCKKCSHTFWPRGDPQEAAIEAVAAAGARSGFAMLNPRARRGAATEEDPLTSLHNWVLPLIVLALGLGWRVWQCAQHAAHYDSVAIWQSLAVAFGEWIAVSIALAGGLLLGAMFMDIDLDKIGPSVLKVVSTAVLMTAVAQFCSSFDQAAEDMWGMTLGVPCILLLAFFMLAATFRVDVLEGLMGSVAITVVVVAIMVAVAFMMQSEAGHVLSFGRPPR